MPWTASNGLAPLALLLALSAVLMAAVWPTLVALNQEWATVNGHHSHGYLLLAIGLYFAWGRRHLLQRSGSSFQSTAIMLVLFIGSFVVWMLADLTHIVVLQYLVLPFIFMLGFGLTFGIKPTLRALSPLLVICFALPIWDAINPYLQQIATTAVGKILFSIGVPHYLMGNRVDLPNGSFVIEGGCSGLGLLLTSLSLAAVLLMTSKVTPIQRILIVLAAIVTALVVNWIRIAIIVQQGYATNMESSLIADHLWLGWVVFALLSTPLLVWASNRLPQAKPLPERNGGSEGGYGRASLAGLCTVLLCCAVFISLQYYTKNPEQTLVDFSAQVKRVELAANTPAAIITDQPEGLSPWQPGFDAPDEELRLAIGADRDPILLYAAVYVTEYQGKELIFYKNKPLGQLQQSSLEFSSNGRAYAMGTINGQNFVLSYWYDISGRQTHDRIQAKLLQLKAKLQRSHVASFVGLFSFCDLDCDAERVQLDAIASAWNAQSVTPVRQVALANQPARSLYE